MIARSGDIFPRLFSLDWVAGDEFSIEHLRGLASRLPDSGIEVGASGDDGYMSATTGAGAAERVDKKLARIGSVATWVVLKDIQQDPAIAPVVDRLFQHIFGSLQVRSADVFNRRCHVFISSGRSRTPLHADDCNGVLVQVRGHKKISMYDMGMNYFSPRLARLKAGSSRVFELPGGREYRLQEYAIEPGTALTIPWNWPHEAETMDGPWSVSLNVSFETRQTARFAMISLANDLLLQAGRVPVAIGINRLADAVKAMAGVTIDRLRLLKRLERLSLDRRIS